MLHSRAPGYESRPDGRTPARVKSYMVIWLKGWLLTLHSGRFALVRLAEINRSGLINSSKHRIRINQTPREDHYQQIEDSTALRVLRRHERVKQKGEL